MSLLRSGKAVWHGTGLEGSGALSTPSGVLNQTAYNVVNRFEDEKGESGTNPEELIAAAHAGCFCMALSFLITGAGFHPTSLTAEATIKLRQQGFDWSFERIELNLDAKIEGIDEEQFLELAKRAKETCPVSMALSAVEIVLNATLQK